MRRVLVLIAIVLAGAAKVFTGIPSEEFLINQVIYLQGDKAMCSAEQVIAPSGAKFVLSAAHCSDLAASNKIKAIIEDGRSYQLEILELDPKSDLMLLSPVADLPGVHIAGSASANEHIRTFTHGHGHPTFMTEGRLLSREPVSAPAFEIVDPVSLFTCAFQEKFGLGAVDGKPYCILQVEETATTAQIMPGSSGGMAVNDRGELVGVCSIYDKGELGYLVTLEDIQAFMRAR